MNLFYILGVYCIFQCILSTRSNLKEVSAAVEHFEIISDSRYKIFIESVISALVDYVALFIAGSIVIYTLMCAAEAIYNWSFL